MGEQTEAIGSGPTASGSRKLLAVAAALLAILATACAHPANVPVARAKVQPDGTISFTITFDILAYLLDQTPELVLDAPMNALLDGPSKDLQARLIAAQQQFMDGFSVGTAQNPGVVDAIDFPTAAEIHKLIDGGQMPRLPVMMTATLRCHLKAGVRKVSFHFPEVLGTVVLTTEFPYEEPVSDSIEAGDSSAELDVPTQAQVAAIAASMRQGARSVPTHADPIEADARRAIQRRYDAWEKAYMVHDVDTLLDTLAPGYTLKTAQGTLIKRTEYEVMLKLRKQKHSDTTYYQQEIIRLTLRDGVAAVWSRETTTDPGINQKTGKPTPVSYQHDYIDLWTFVQGKWLLKSTVTQKEQIVAAPSK